jgi:hypothetical protein
MSGIRRTQTGGFAMALAERRAQNEFETNELPALRARIDAALGVAVPLDVDWVSLTVDGESHLFVECWKQVYFEPLIAGLTSVGRDQMGRDAMRDGIRGVAIRNSKNHSYPDGWAALEEGILILDHDPLTNAGDVDARAGALTAMLERTL